MHAFRDVQWSGRLAGSGGALPPTLLLPMSPAPPPTLTPIPTEPRTHLIEHVLEVQLQVAEQAGRQGKPGQGVGQAALQVSAEHTAAQMLQRPGLPRQGEEGGVETLMLLGTERGAQRGSLGNAAPTG